MLESIQHEPNNIDYKKKNGNDDEFTLVLVQTQRGDQVGMKYI